MPVSARLLNVTSSVVFRSWSNGLPPPPNNPVVSVRSLTSIGIVGTSVRSLYLPLKIGLIRLNSIFSRPLPLFSATVIV